MAEDGRCACGAAVKLVFACSGASDVGAIADRTARTLGAEKAGRMYCLAGIGGRVSGIVESTRAAARVLAIDGCALNCAHETLTRAGFTDFAHLRVTDLGMEKGKTPVSDEAVARVAAEARALLACPWNEGEKA